METNKKNFSVSSIKVCAAGIEASTPCLRDWHIFPPGNEAFSMEIYIILRAPFVTGAVIIEFAGIWSNCIPHRYTSASDTDRLYIGVTVSDSMVGPGESNVPIYPVRENNHDMMGTCSYAQDAHRWGFLQ